MSKSIAEIVWDIEAQPCWNRRSETAFAEARRSCEEIDCTEYVARALVDHRARSTEVRYRTEYDLENFGTPTIDDIRSWLHGQDCSVWAGEDADTPMLLNATSVHLWVVTDRTTEIEASTLLEALEQAVRLVAGET